MKRKTGKRIVRIHANPRDEKSARAVRQIGAMVKATMGKCECAFKKLEGDQYEGIIESPEGVFAIRLAVTPEEGDYSIKTFIDAAESGVRAHEEEGAVFNDKDPSLLTRTIRGIVARLLVDQVESLALA